MKPDILATITAERRADALHAQRLVPLETLKRSVAPRTPGRFPAAIRANTGTVIIAEIKKASPSAGILRPDYDPVAIARSYEAAGATAISILTEPRHFLGTDADLRAVRAAVKIPILRKDFICEPYQVYETAALGADILLLIVAALTPRELRVLRAEAKACGLDVIAEVHDEAELKLALELDDVVIGVNNRNLKTLKTDVATSFRLRSNIPSDRLCISESGISERSQINELQQVGYNGFLIGEVLMRGTSPEAELKRLLDAESDSGRRTETVSPYLKVGR